MAERKGLIKYYPAEFDPAKIPRSQKHQQQKSRTMLPMTVRCNTCGNYMHEGTKFNARKEEVFGQAYLGSIKVFRFYLKCTRCSADFILKTDPKNSGYVIESGGTGRTLQSHNSNSSETQDGDAMLLLDKRIKDSRRAMAMDASLELRSVKSRRDALGFDTNAKLQGLKRISDNEPKDADADDGKGDAKRYKVPHQTVDVSSLPRPIYRKPINVVSRR